MSTKETPTFAQDARLQLMIAYLQGAGGEVAPEDQVAKWIQAIAKFVETGAL